MAAVRRAVRVTVHSLCICRPESNFSSKNTVVDLRSLKTYRTHSRQKGILSAERREVTHATVRPWSGQHTHACMKPTLRKNTLCATTLQRRPPIGIHAKTYRKSSRVYTSSLFSPVSALSFSYAFATLSAGSCSTCSFHASCCSRVRCGLGGSSKR